MVLLQLSRVLKTKMVEIVTRALNKLMMRAKINAKCANGGISPAFNPFFDSHKL